MAAENIQALGFGHGCDSEVLMLDGDYLEGALSAVERLSGTRERLLARLMAGTAGLVVIEAAADDMTGAVGLVTKTQDADEIAVRLDLQVLRPVDPMVADMVATAMEWAARLSAVPAVRIVADGPFPCPRGYDFEAGEDSCQIMARQVGAARAN